MWLAFVGFDRLFFELLPLLVQQLDRKLHVAIACCGHVGPYRHRTLLEVGLADRHGADAHILDFGLGAQWNGIDGWQIGEVNLVVGPIGRVAVGKHEHAGQRSTSVAFPNRGQSCSQTRRISQAIKFRQIFQRAKPLSKSVTPYVKALTQTRLPPCVFGRQFASHLRPSPSVAGVADLEALAIVH